MPDHEPAGAVGADAHQAEAAMLAAREKWQVQPGDLWEAGRHRLLCAPSTDPAAVARVTGGEKVPLLLTDPPYSSGGWQEANKSAGTWGDIAGDSLGTKGYQALLYSTLTAARPHTAYIFTDWRMWCPLAETVEKSGNGVRSMLVWDKLFPGVGGLWRPQHELILYASRSGGKRIKGVPATPNVIPCARSGNLWHYTEKPVELLRRLLEADAAARPGAPVYDPFCGSGSTLLAAEGLGRVGWGIDVEPACIAVALERLSQAGLVAAKVLA